MQYTADTTYQRPAPPDLRQRMKRLSSWYDAPLSPRAECAVAVIMGSVMFLLFVFVASIA